MRDPVTKPEMREWRLSDGYRARGRVWPAENPDAPLVLYLHGIQSHGGWFEWSASLLAQHGARVVLPDRRGSGLNTDRRGDAPAVQRWLRDIDDLVAAEQSTEHAPVAICAVSWGGKLALAWALQRPQRVVDLLLVAPGLFPAVDVRLSTKLRIGLALLVQPAASFTIPLSDPALFTDNPAGQAFIAHDPHKLTRATARFLYQSRRLDGLLRRTPARALPARATLLMAGRDRIIVNDVTKRWLNKIAAGNPTVHEFASAAHTLEFEADDAPYQAVLTAWAASLGDARTAAPGRDRQN